MLPALFIVYGVAVFVFFLFGLLRVRAVWRLEQRLSVAARHLPGVKALARARRPALSVLAVPALHTAGDYVHALGVGVVEAAA